MLVVLFLYVPFMMVTIASFNASKYGGEWVGFSLKWYRSLFQNEQILEALNTTLVVAVVSTLIATTLGTMAAIALHRAKSRIRGIYSALVHTPLVVPDILHGVGLLLLFVTVKQILAACFGWNVELGMTTIIIAHVTFCVSYVTLVVLGRLETFDEHLVEAAHDLGASTLYTFFRVTLPLILPGVIAGALFAFTLSIDDFVITFFVKGAGDTTLPIYIQSAMRRGNPAEMNALSVIFLAFTFFFVFITQFLLLRKKDGVAKEKARSPLFKVILTSIILVPCIGIVTLICIAIYGDDRPVLHIYNWGDYISPEVIEAFEKEYNCKVKIDTFDSNEAMYAKLKQGAGAYDIIVPSSYMAELINEQGMLYTLDHSKLPNVKKYFDEERYAHLLLDQTMTYSVPYFVSVTGIGYDSRKMTNFQPTWAIFNDSSYKGACSLLNDHRETLAAALIYCGYDPNTGNPNEVNEAVKCLRYWKANIAKFEVDDAKRALASGEFKMIHTYNGDMLQVMSEKPYIRFVIPKEGATVTFDNFVIPKKAVNIDLAHEFINFMYRPENAAKNMNEIMYVMPNNMMLSETESVVDLIDEELRENSAFMIPTEDLKRCKPLKDLGELNDLYNDAWDRVRN
jgi:spermidine/putrescine transport system permease protein